MQKKNKKGFTIVELVVVIAVIGILSAILIPTFMGLSENARAKALQSDLSSIYTQYAVEAADGVVDGYYKGTGLGTDNKSITGQKDATIQILAQDKVVIDYKGVKYYIADTSKNEWVEFGTGSHGLEVVDALGNGEKFYTADSAHPGQYSEFTTATTTTAVKVLSTFVGGVVYAKA